MEYCNNGRKDGRDGVWLDAAILRNSSTPLLRPATSFLGLILGAACQAIVRRFL